MYKISGFTKVGEYDIVDGSIQTESGSNASEVSQKDDEELL